VVAYALQWCFTKADGTNSYQRETYGDHTALMEGTVFSDKYEDQSAWIKPNAARFFSMVSPNGSSLIRVPVSRDEAEQIKQGARFSESELLQRYASELSKYVNVTVSIDGAFFDDGTFVGDDSTGFFAATNAQVEARHDLLNEMALGLSKNTKREVFNQVEVVADQPDVTLTSDSTPTDHYNFWKKFYAKNVLAIRNTYGEENGMTAALYPRQKPWRKLQKKEPLK